MTTMAGAAANALRIIEALRKTSDQAIHQTAPFFDAAAQQNSINS
ncbi:hypothetical protein [Methylocapsa sp. S129]|nr:hypothetical protein [Methylocapsa sp. S129]